MALPLSRILPIILAVLFLIAITFKTVFPGDDPYRCRAVLNTGRWIDPPDEDGNRDPFNHWQPDGCILHKYSSADIQQCMEGRRIVIGGDSTSRNVAYAIGRLLDREAANKDRKLYGHSPIFNLTYHGIRIERHGNVWLETVGQPEQEAFVKNLEQYTDENKNPPSIKDQQGPALVYLAAGIWFTNLNNTLNHDGRMAAFHAAISNLSETLGDTGRDMFSDPMDPFDGVGNQLFYSPPYGPNYLGDKPYRLNDTSRRSVEVIEMQNWLHETDGTWNFPLTWSIPSAVVNQTKSCSDPLSTGLHVIDSVSEMRANVILNLRCNAKLDRIKGYPSDRTCCTDYGGKPFSQLGLVMAGLIYLAACVICEVLDVLAHREEPRWSLFNLRLGSFAMALLMCYYADRTQMMAKGSKLWSLDDFLLLCACCVAIALVTIRKAAPSSSEYLSLAVEQDEPFLSRDHTDEWKGWMQFMILVYYWASPSSTSTYIMVRLFAAAYLFLTAYGHTVYFLDNKDFSFDRVAAVLLRVNLLSCSLAYFMNTEYMFYFFSPLVSFWFLVIYATMAIGHTRCNGDVQFLVAKICIAALLVSVLLRTPLISWIFSFLRYALNIQWSYSEWHRRVSMDSFIVYVGMLVAVAKSEVGKSLHLGLRLTLASQGLFAFYGYFRATSEMTSEEYELWHPFISFVPILAFVALRNVSGPVRNFHSKAMVWLGRCSLETFTLHFHLLLAADRKGVLVVDGFYGDATLKDRWRSLIFIVPVFLCISSATATATGELVRVILRGSPETEKYEGTNFLRVVHRIPGASLISAPKVRIFCILLIMLLLNILSP